MGILISFVRKYPYRSLFAVVALLLATLAEGFGISIFIPMLDLIINPNAMIPTETGGFADGIEAGLKGMARNLSGTYGVEHTVAGMLILFVGCICLKCALVITAQRHVGYTTAMIAMDLRMDFLRALFKARWEFFLKRPMGSLVNGVAIETARSSSAFSLGAKMFSILIEAFVFSILAIIVSWQATLLAIGVGLVILVVMKIYITKTRKAGERLTRAMQSLVGLMSDCLVSIKPLKAMGREDTPDAVLKKKATKLNRAKQKIVLSNTALSNLQEPLVMAFMAIILYAALIHLEMSLATIMAMIYLIRKVLKSIHKIQMVYQKFVAIESAYWSFDEKCKAALMDKETWQGDRSPVFMDRIRLDQVTFCYGQKTVLDNMTMQLPHGKFVALVGHSGVGKTTVADLIIGLLRPQKGEIWVDDLTLAQIDIRQWRRMIGYVPQETLLLHDTVYANVTLGDQSISMDRVEKALKDAGAWEFVSLLSKGVHTVVGERGSKFSGGQRQRIAIARALLNEPKLLVLDEATTALDAESEKAICQTLKGLTGQVTILAISHQKAILQASDIAYRLDAGGVTLLSDVLAFDDAVESNKGPLPESPNTAVAAG